MCRCAVRVIDCDSLAMIEPKADSHEIRVKPPPGDRAVGNL